MTADYKERNFPFLLVSLIVHISLLAALPLVGYPQIGKPYGTGGPLEVTILSSATASSSSASTSQTVAETPKKPVAQVTKPTTPTVKPATTRVLTTNNPVASAKQNDSASATAVTPKVVEPTSTTPTGSSTDTPAVAEIPFGGTVVSIIQTPSYFKEAHSLTKTATVRMSVAVSMSGSWKSAKIVQSNGTTAVDDFAIKATQKFLKYDTNPKDYEVTVIFIVNPENKTTNWSIPDDRVRIVE